MSRCNRTLFLQCSTVRVMAIFLFVPIAAMADDNQAQNDVRRSDPGKGVNFYSIEKEIALGKQMAQDLERQAKIVDEAVIAEYVNRLGQNLVRSSDAKVPFTVKIIDSSEVNAFALPGGFMFVNAGLILKAQNEAELAGVLAHEIAHVAARHGTKQATRGQLANIASIPLIFMGGWAGYAVRQAAGLAIPLGFLKFSRGMEREADRLGLEYMYEAGYDPLAFLDFFERIQTMEKKKPGTLAQVFSSHPPTGDRIKRAQKEIQNALASRPEYVLDTSEFREVHDRVSRLLRRNDKGDNSLPTLRRRTSSGNGDDERPTLKRRN